MKIGRMIDGLIDAVLGPFRRFGVTANRYLEKLCKIDVYTIEGNTIVKDKGRFAGSHSVRIEDIKAWHVYPEMGFDLVEIQLLNGTALLWRDVDNSLIALLRQTVPKRECAGV